MAVNSKIAIKAHLCRNTATYGSPTWANCTSVLDAAKNLAWDKGDASSRASRIKLYAKTMAELEVTAKVKICDGADYAALYSASLLDTALDMLVLDGPHTVQGSQGVRAHFQVFTANQDQTATNVLYDEFSLSPTPADNLPMYALVGEGGAITYTAF